MALYKSDVKDAGDALAQLILGGHQKKQQAGLEAQLKDEQINRNLATAQGLAAKMGVKPGKYAITANENGLNVNPEAPDPLRNLLMPLTPAQESAEKAVGKQIADFDSAGGRPAMEKNLQALQDVNNDLTQGKRDGYDRIVGGALSGFPTLMGLLAPSEKARRDRARSTANNAARQSDPNPTQQQIETIMGQIYDPSSTNEENQARIQRFQTEQQQKARQMEQASQNYKRTGYATIGNASHAPAQKQVAKKLYSPSRNQTKVVYSDGSEEILDGQQ